MKLVVPQRLLGPRMFLACALMVELLIIMAIDMYVPALPSMQREFGVTAAYLNLTMFAFFAVGAVGVVLAGPMSDRLGRKPVVVAGCVLFTASSLGCARRGACLFPHDRGAWLRSGHHARDGVGQRRVHGRGP